MSNSLKNKRILITGIKGFVAPYLAEEILNLGGEVYGIDLPGKIKEHPLKRLIENINIFEGDLEENNFILKVIEKIKPDFIFHLAAKSSAFKSFENPFDFLKTNCIGTLNLLETLKKNSAESTFIFAGSSDEYGIVIFSNKQYKNLKNKYGEITPEPFKIPEIPINENNPLRPVSPYALTKVYGDFLVREYSSFTKIKGIVARSFNHEGAGRGEGFVSTDIIKQVVLCKREGINKIKVGNIMAMRDWSHVRDIVKGYVLLALKGEKGNVYNIGSGRTNSVLTFILLSLECAGFKIFEIKSKRYLKKKIEDPLKEKKINIEGFKFDCFNIDELIIKERINWDIKDEGIIVETQKGRIEILIDEKKLRPSDTPILLCNNKKIKKLGFKINFTLRDIIQEMLEYYETISLK